MNVAYSLRMIQNNNKEILWFWLIVLIVTQIRPYKASSGQTTHKDKGFLMFPCLYGPNPHSPISDCVGTAVGQKNVRDHNPWFIQYALFKMTQVTIICLLNIFCWLCQFLCYTVWSTSYLSTCLSFQLYTVCMYFKLINCVPRGPCSTDDFISGLYLNEALNTTVR